MAACVSTVMQATRLLSSQPTPHCLPHAAAYRIAADRTVQRREKKQVRPNQEARMSNMLRIYQNISYISVMHGFQMTAATEQVSEPPSGGGGCYATTAAAVLVA